MGIRSQLPRLHFTQALAVAGSMRARIGAGFLLALATALLVKATVVAARSATGVNIHFGSSCIDGWTRPETAIGATLRSSEGAVRARFQALSDERGRWIGCFPEDVLPAGVTGSSSGGSTSPAAC